MKVTKDNAVVGLKVVINKDSEYIGQQKEAVYGVIVNSAAHFPARSDYAWVEVNWIAENGKAITCNNYRIGYSNIFDLNVYQEESKDVMPKYVECVGGYGDCVKGTVYCTANEIEENGMTWQEILISCGNLGSYFIPSTREAFDLYHKPKIEEKPEILVFGKFKIGSIVVSLTDYGPRYKGGIYKIVEKTRSGNITSATNLVYTNSKVTPTASEKADDWRQASPEECKAFEQGITNIKDIKTEEDLVGRYLKTLVNNPVSIGMDIGEYLLVTSFNTDNATYDVTRVRDNHTGFVIEVSDLPKFEVMPIGFTPNEVKEQPINIMELTGDWCIEVTDSNRGTVKPTLLSLYNPSKWTVSSNNYYGIKDGKLIAQQSPFGRELTLDEFKRLVLKEGINPEEFKIEDWVTIIANTNNSVNQVGDVGKITKKDGFHFAVTVEGRGDTSNWTKPSDMRLATPEEIAKARGYITTDVYLDVAQLMSQDYKVKEITGDVEVPYPTRSYKNFKECYTKLPVVTSVKRSNIVPLKLEKQKSLINLPTI